jgi:hypothetical protein
MSAHQEIDDQLVSELARKALDRIINSNTPRMLIWCPQTRSIRFVSLKTAYANDMAGKATCLGTYDFDVRLEDIEADLRAVCSGELP